LPSRNQGKRSGEGREYPLFVRLGKVGGKQAHGAVEFALPPARWIFGDQVDDVVLLDGQLVRRFRVIVVHDQELTFDTTAHNGFISVRAALITAKTTLMRWTTGRTFLCGGGGVSVA
jgi:hypothetical protein